MSVMNYRSSEVPMSFLVICFLHRIRNFAGSPWRKLTLAALVAMIAVVAFAQAAPTAPRDSDVIAFLNQTINWYRQRAAEQQFAVEPNDALYFADGRQLADRIVRLSFDYARAQAEAKETNAAGSQPASQDSDAASRVRRMSELQAKYDAQIKQSQREVESLKLQLESASGRKRKALLLAIGETQSEIDLLQTRRDTVRNLLDFLSSPGTGATYSGSLRSQVDELARAIPAALENTKAAPAEQNAAASSAPAASTAAAARKSEPSGILALASDLFVLRRKLHTLDQSIQLSDALSQSAKNLRTPLIAVVRDLARQGDDLASQPSSQDPAVLTQQKAQLDALTAKLKQASAVVLPLGKQSILLDVYRRNLSNWHNTVDEQYSAELKGLIVRLVALAVILALVFGVSQLWRKAIQRYVQEPRRRYQFNLLRRIVVGGVVTIIVAFAFASQLGSLATFAGLLTAGIAVALQNVILSIAGYFFLIGKYGVRVGDRVQIAGVSGEVVDIGLVRLHLMEIGDGGSSARPTGRVVVFSNAIVFQPNAGFFKQIPGTNFVWHEITLTLAADSDYHQVEERTLKAVERVFADYRESMERQHRHIERSLGPVFISSLRPESRLHLTQKGLEVVIRYPVELNHAAEIDDRITRELLTATAREPQLRLADSGGPSVKEVVSSSTAT